MVRTVIFIACAAALLGTSQPSLHAAEWYKCLRPGVTRPEILKLAGTPSESRSGMDVYTNQRGRIECVYEKHVLRRALYYNPPDGAMTWTLYDRSGDSSLDDTAQRRAYLKAGKFTVATNFPGSSVYTVKYLYCTCYEVDRGFIVVEPIIECLGGFGFFADKAARVLWLKPDGTETVLYRAADHWKDLKPPQLSDKQLANRQLRLKQAGDHIFPMGITNVFGGFSQCDSGMGSGVDYSLFYLGDGLAIVNYSRPDASIDDNNIKIMKPGMTNLTLSEWLSTQPAPPLKSASPPR